MTRLRILRIVLKLLRLLPGRLAVRLGLRVTKIIARLLIRNVGRGRSGG
jgi:hypothetical protein